MSHSSENHDLNKGIGYAIAAYLLYGFYPVYWKLLSQVPALQLLAHRVLWSFLLLFLGILILRQGKAFRTAALRRRVLGIYALAAILIGINWLTYVWAVGAGYIVETSLGYFICPLVSVLLGVFFLGERLRPLQWVTIGLATVGVLYLTFGYGSLPWIALTLAISFGLYGFVKKTAPLGPLYGLTLETGILFLPALGFLLYATLAGQGAFLHGDFSTDILLVMAGIVTIAPLLFFASAVQRASLSTVGLLLYINPTIQFLLGVFVYHEPFNQARLIGFGIIWAALILFVLDQSLHGQRQPERGQGEMI
ncbi:MAG: EamA family transporter RarD [Anaerolineales bacterium]